MNPKLALITLASFLLASCAGNEIKLTTTIPAQLDLKRGSKVSISYRGRLADKITDQFVDMIQQDGYYHVVSDTPADYDICFNDYIPVYSSSAYKTECSIRRGSRHGELLWERAFNKKSTPIKYFGNEIEYMARQCYNMLVPHEESVVMHPKPSTAELELAVKKCQEGDWDAAKTLIQEAVAKYPNDPENYFMLAILEAKNMNYDASDVFLRKAYSMKPDKRYKQAMENNAAMRHNDAAVIRQLSGQQD